MAVYSIKDLEKLSGIKAHTLRVWEQRYDIIHPKRTKTNIRYYLDEDLKFILNIALLNKNGIKISKIAKMSREEIAEKVAAISEINFEYGTQLDALTISMIEMDEYKFDRIVSTNIQQLGFERTMMEIIYPFLDKLSVLWLTGSINPVQENFMSYLIRQKIVVAIDKEALPAAKSARRFLIYLPEGEKQELSMLFMHYLLKSRGCHVAYIGQDITFTDLSDACTIYQPDFIFTMITETFSKEPLQQYVDRLSESFPDCEVLLSGYQVVAQKVDARKNIRILRSLQQTMDFLGSLDL
ncbi:MerR family transcriptional regulator [Phaeodactylibacter luteus]|uniref:MerR family transcriptional regulator n=1 Tax=Phaeodactylibacter luteus TaxID=1564516 RepID=A0A5C6RIE7_9BACT|nr:MerR family transcriptional regulator [Phaeodactylibacter luteus]TXB61754.1 MerR family transcriptional regulator [Phaeodactylibacter luteus]